MGFCWSFRSARGVRPFGNVERRALGVDRRPADRGRASSARATISRGPGAIRRDRPRGTCLGPRFVYAASSQLPRAPGLDAAGASARDRQERAGRDLLSQPKIYSRDLERARSDAALRRGTPEWIVSAADDDRQPNRP
jgi:hypothetical protein